jgi:hypothetical protein
MCGTGEVYGWLDERIPDGRKKKESNNEKCLAAQEGMHSIDERVSCVVYLICAPYHRFILLTPLTTPVDLADTRARGCVRT